MWTLVKESTGGQVYHFLTATDYVVGRKNCAVLVEDDQSISRVHATFSVNHSFSNLANPDVIPVLTIKDSSKYGTFVNGEKMQKATPRDLASGDKITFGVYNSKFRVTYEPLVACSSCLNASEKNSLSQAVLELGGHIVNNWTEKCTHLVMTSVKVTIKTICALICCRAIVKPEYFNEVKNSIQQKKPLPIVTSYMPIMDEPSLQDEPIELFENPRRKSVFKDKTFLFLSAKQYKKLSPAIHFGGGKFKLLTGALDNPSLLENPNTCVIDAGMTESQLSESRSTPTWITSTMDVLRSKGLRTIPEAEIGLAVIYMSTEIYCNPLHLLTNRNETDKDRGNIEASTLSLSMAVDETVLPAATFHTTAYVANTEPQDQTLNCMEVSGVREVNETPKNSRRNNKPSMSMGQDPEESICEERTAAPPEKRTRQVSQTETSNYTKERPSQKREPANKIQNYFQPMAKKRDRNENDESEMSSKKLARVETRTSLSSKPIKDLFQSSEKAVDRNLSEAVDIDLGTEPVVAATTSFTNNAVKKRKEPDNMVEESDLEEEEEEIGPKSSLNQVKRPRYQPEDDNGADLKKESPERGGDGSASFQKINTKVDIKLEPESQHEEDKKMLIKPKVEDDSGLPSKLLVLEFCSLMVSRPTRNKGNANHEHGPNYKKFRKISYPGAGSFPHIIGGSDLIAHDRKKNSELEQWLRQEMEEQTQQAKEQSLAEDLFRYNPKMGKKKR